LFLSQVVINSNVTKDTQYTRASETFHQWSDSRLIYGLNFGTKEEAETFGSGFESIVQRLKSGGGTLVCFDCVFLFVVQGALVADCCLLL
jgi:hypothetical protein